MRLEVERREGCCSPWGMDPRSRFAVAPGLEGQNVGWDVGDPREENQVPGNDSPSKVTENGTQSPRRTGT